MIVDFIVAVLVAFSACLLAVNLTRPIARLLGRSKQIAVDDLTGEPLTVTSGDEIGQVTEATHQIRESLQKLVSEMAQWVDNVASAATEIAAGMQN